MAARLVAVAAACLLLGGSASAGLYAPPPGDQFPVWTPDGASLLYVAGNDQYSLHAVTADGSADRRFAPLGQFARYALARDGVRVALTDYERDGYRLFVLDGGRRDFGPASPFSRPAWAPDQRRIAFVRTDGVALADTATGAVSLLAAGQFAEPAWSPDGRAVAVVGQPGLTVVDVADGRAQALAQAEQCCFGAPAWSPDGSRIALLERTAGGNHVRLVRADGGGSTSLPLGRGNEGIDPLLSWTADSGSIVYAGVSAVFALYRLDVSTGSSTRLLRFGETSIVGSPGGYVAPSPDGAHLAFQAGGECRDRVGIYVVGVDGHGLRRLTNSCRIPGTAGADRLVGTPLADVLDGLAGNDRLEAVDPGYVGDTLQGGSGDDLLLGGYRQDVLDGGPGADRLFGGPSGDLLVGGPGRDTLSAQGGLDVVDAYDGARDTISCGTSAPTTTPERDTVYADRFDRVARDCEVVFRRQRLS